MDASIGANLPEGLIIGRQSGRRDMLAQAFPADGPIRDGAHDFVNVPVPW